MRDQQVGRAILILVPTISRANFDVRAELRCGLANAIKKIFSSIAGRLILLMSVKAFRAYSVAINVIRVLRGKFSSLIQVIVKSVLGVCPIEEQSACCSRSRFSYYAGLTRGQSRPSLLSDSTAKILEQPEEDRRGYSIWPWASHRLQQHRSGRGLYRFLEGL